MTRPDRPGRRLRLGYSFTYAPLDPPAMVEAARRVEALGYDSVWTSEAYGQDAVVPLTWIAAHTSHIRVGTSIMQIPGRTPAMTAMTAMTLDLMSSGRFVLGLGASGAQVAEGWHGQPYRRPLARTYEYVDAVRQVLRRERPLELHGEHYDIPFTGPGSTGAGRPLRSLLGARPEIPIYLAALGPRNVRLAMNVADGLLPLFFSPTRVEAAFDGALTGVPDGFDVAASVQVVVGDDVDACRDRVRPLLALYVGGMGGRGNNFYNELVCRLGFEAEAAAIQDHYLAGRRTEAAAAVPDALVDEVALVGPPGRIRERLEPWCRSPVTTLIVTTDQPAAAEVVAEAVA